MSVSIRAEVPLAPLTTLELGGLAKRFLEVEHEDDVRAGLVEAHARGLRALVLGGGSNLVVPDEGIDALVLAMRTRGIRWEKDGPDVLVEAAAGEPWDALVERTVAEDLAGLECLSGIPGLAGATPIQNVGAYGQEVAERLERVRVFDRRLESVRELAPAELELSYRDSALKRDPDRAVVLSVTFRLTKGGPPRIAYAELARALSAEEEPSLMRVREAVIALRRKKSMVIDPSDPNRRSAGSFFTNPIVSPAQANEVVRLALEAGIVAAPGDVPRWAQPNGDVKLAAGWLIERAGIQKGMRRGAVGISSAHALALVHHGGGTTRELLALADEIRRAVDARWGVTLEREPVLFGG